MQEKGFPMLDFHHLSQTRHPRPLRKGRHLQHRDWKHLHLIPTKMRQRSAGGSPPASQSEPPASIRSFAPPDNALSIIETTDYPKSGISLKILNKCFDGRIRERFGYADPCSGEASRSTTRSGGSATPTPDYPLI